MERLLFWLTEKTDPIESLFAKRKWLETYVMWQKYYGLLLSIMNLIDH